MCHCCPLYQWNCLLVIEICRVISKFSTKRTQLKGTSSPNVPLDALQSAPTAYAYVPVARIHSFRHSCPILRIRTVRGTREACTLAPCLRITAEGPLSLPRHDPGAALHLRCSPALSIPAYARCRLTRIAPRAHLPAAIVTRVTGNVRP